MKKLVASLLDRWRQRRAAANQSSWDNPLTGNDLLAAMVTTRRHRKGRPLP